MCRVLGVSPSGYYAWRKRPASQRRHRDAELREQIGQIHQKSRGTYGAPRIHAELRDQRIPVGRKRVARLMAEGNLRGVSRRRGTRTTLRSQAERPAPDLVDQNFAASGRDRLWVADINLRADLGGFLVSGGGPRCLESPDRRLGHGEAPAHRTRAVRVGDGLVAAQTYRRDPSFGSREVSIRRWRSDCAAGRPGSGLRWPRSATRMTTHWPRASSPHWNASFWTGQRFRTRAEARIAIFEYIEGWYNPHRRHSALAYESPIRYEA
jgi:putative transposase